MNLLKELTELRNTALDANDFYSVKLLCKVIGRVQDREARLASKAAEKVGK